MGSARWRVLSLGLVLLGVAFCAGSAFCASSDVEWRMLQQNAQRMGYSEGIGPSVPEQLFEFEAAYWVRSSCIVAPDGSILIGSYLGMFYCLESDLWLRWWLDVGTDIEGTPCLSPDGMLYLPTMDGRLLCIDSNNSYMNSVDTKWVYSGASPIKTSPCLMADGAIVVTLADGSLVVLERDGEIRWTFASESGFEAPPAVAQDGSIIVANSDGQVIALDREGTIRWTFPTLSQVRASPTVHDDLVYVVTYGGVVHALSLSNGQEVWSFGTGCLNIGSSPAVDIDGNIYFGTQQGLLFSLYPGGAERWRFQAGGEIESSPAIDAKGKVYFGCSDFCLYCVSSTGMEVFKYKTRGKVTSSPAIGPAEPFDDINGDGVCDGDEIYVDVNYNHRWDGNYVCFGSWDRTISVIGEKSDAVPALSDGVVFPEKGDVTTMFTFSVGYRCDPASSPDNTWVVLDGSPYTMTLYREDYYGPGIDEYRFETQLSVGEHNYYFAFRDMDNDSVRLPTDGTFEGPVVSPDNRPPDLKSGYVTPASAIIGSTFTFTVDVADPDMEMLAGIYLMLNGPGMSIPEIYSIEDFKGSQENPGFYTFTYQIELTNIGEYEFVFGATDFRGGLGRLPAEGWFHGPTVTASGSGSPWPMFRNNRNHTGLTMLEGPYMHTLRWVGHAGGGIVSSPAIGSTGNLYVGSLDGSLYAFDMNGVPLWSYASGDKIVTSPAVGFDDVVYFGSDDGSVYAVRDGELVWRTPTGGVVRSSPVLGSSGSLYVGSNDGYLYALATDTGEKLWSFNIGSWMNTSPAVVRLHDRDIIYVTAMDGDLHAIHNLDSGGQYRLVLYHTSHWITSSPCVGPDGTIYFGSNDQHVYAVDPEGNLLWSYETGSWVRSSPALDKDGNLYVGSLDHKLYCLDKDGKLNWATDLGEEIVGSCAVDARGLIYVGTSQGDSDGGELFCLDRGGEVLWSFKTYDAVNSSPAIGKGNMVYFGSLDWNLYAIGGRDEVAPWILSGGFFNSVVTASEGGVMRLLARVWDEEDNVEYVEVFEQNIGSLDLYLLDNGLGGDEVAGDGIFTIQMNVPPGEMQAARHTYELIARDGAGNRSEIWPYLEIRSEGLPTGLLGNPFTPLVKAGFDVIEPSRHAPFGQTHGRPIPLKPEMYNPDAPVVLEGGYGFTRLTSEGGGRLTVFARVGDRQGAIDIQEVNFALFYFDLALGADMVDLDGDGVYVFDQQISAGIIPGTYAVSINVVDRSGNLGTWPALTVWQ